MSDSARPAATPEASERFYGGRRVMITGAAGFIGRSLARRLVALGAGVPIVEALIRGHGGNLFNVKDVAGRVRLNIAGETLR